MANADGAAPFAPIGPGPFLFGFADAIRPGPVIAAYRARGLVPGATISGSKAGAACCCATPGNLDAVANTIVVKASDSGPGGGPKRKGFGHQTKPSCFLIEFELLGKRFNPGGLGGGLRAITPLFPPRWARLTRGFDEPAQDSGTMTATLAWSRWMGSGPRRTGGEIFSNVESRAQLCNPYLR